MARVYVPVHSGLMEHTNERWRNQIQGVSTSFPAYQPLCVTKIKCEILGGSDKSHPHPVIIAPPPPASKPAESSTAVCVAQLGYTPCPGAHLLAYSTVDTGELAFVRAAVNVLYISSRKGSDSPTCTPTGFRRESSLLLCLQ